MLVTDKFFESSHKDNPTSNQSENIYRPTYKQGCDFAILKVLVKSVGGENAKVLSYEVKW